MSGNPSTLSLQVLRFEDADALTLALQLYDNPPPQAVSRFEIQAPGEGQPHGWQVDAYFDREPDVKALCFVLDSALDFNLPAFVLEPTPDLNWVAISQAALAPVQAGRFLVHGRHDRSRTASGPNTIEIDAGEAFGTAHHATTILCLEAIDTWTRKKRFQNALDLGCGTGVLAIALARAAPSCRIIATDIDEKAVEITRFNAKNNRVGGRITSFRAQGLSNAKLQRSNQFDFILANILAGPLMELACNISIVSKTGATVVLSGLLTRQAGEVLAAYRAADFMLIEHRRLEEWSALVVKKS